MLQKQTVSEQCLQLIGQLMQIPALESFRLAGGTALALQKGHRVSVDLDLFAGQPFENLIVLQALEAYLSPAKPVDVRTYVFGFFCRLQDVKTDFMYWGDAFIEDPLVIEGIRMATPLEIFAMKLNAITTRKTQKDFFDIAVLLEEIPLSNALQAYQKKYPYNDIAPVLKQLSSSNEADGDLQPILLLPLSWTEAKERIAVALKNYWEAEVK